MQMKNSKGQLSTRGLPICGPKERLIDILTVALNDKADMTDISKIVKPLPLPRLNNNTGDNYRRGVQGQSVHANLKWTPLEQHENKTTTSTKNFTACDPKYPASIELSFTQRNNYSQRYNRKSFSKKNKNIL